MKYKYKLGTPGIVIKYKDRKIEEDEEDRISIWEYLGLDEI